MDDEEAEQGVWQRCIPHRRLSCGYGERDTAPGWKVAGSLEPELQREKAHSLIYLTSLHVPAYFLSSEELYFV